jgi:hypothetical protein
MRHIKMVAILLLYVMHFFFVCIPLFLMIIIGLEIVYTLKYFYDSWVTVFRHRWI